MATYVAFLRAINLGSRRRFAKDDLASVTAATRDFGDVATYLNTGNVRFSTSMRSTVRIEQALERAYAGFTGFEVPTMVLSVADLVEMVRAGEKLSTDHLGKPHVSLLKTLPSTDAVAAVEALSSEHEQVHVVGRGAHLLLGEQYHTSRLPTAVEKHLGPATNRTLGVLRTLVEKWA